MFHPSYCWKFSVLCLVLTTCFHSLRECNGIDLVEETNHNSLNDTMVPSTTSNSTAAQKPIIYTYFEMITSPFRLTGMEDQDDADLLLFWKEQWSMAGWHPLVLTIEDTRSLEDFSTLEDRLSKDLRLDAWSRVLFHRWMAMASVGGGWYVDYDVFPLLDVSALSNEISSGKNGFSPTEMEASPTTLELPHHGRMAVHDILSPTLATGTGEEWLSTLKALLVDAQKYVNPKLSPTRNQDKRMDKNNLSSTNTSTATMEDGATIIEPRDNNYWTDSMGINNLIQDYHGSRTLTTGTHGSFWEVDMARAAPITGKRVLLPYGRNDPTMTGNAVDCSSRSIRNRWVLHMGPKIFHQMMRGTTKSTSALRMEERHPRHRRAAAERWLKAWKQICRTDKSIVEKSDNSTFLQL